MQRALSFKGIQQKHTHWKKKVREWSDPLRVNSLQPCNQMGSGGLQPDSHEQCASAKDNLLCLKTLETICCPSSFICKTNRYDKTVQEIHLQICYYIDLPFELQMHTFNCLLDTSTWVFLRHLKLHMPQTKPSSVPVSHGPSQKAQAINPFLPLLAPQA